MPLINNCYGYVKSGSVPQLCDQVDNFKVSSGELSAKLTWSAPATDEDSSFVGTRIVRKVGSVPKNKSDGTVVYEGTELTYTDTGLTEGTTYYYRAFAYNDKKKYQTALCVASIKAVRISTTLNDNPWDVIRSISDLGQGENYWAVGDCKEIVLNGAIGEGLTLSNYKVCVFILGFNHNAELEGENRIHFQLGKTALTSGVDVCLVDKSYANYYFYENDTSFYSDAHVLFSMNSSASTDSYGWEQSRMRTSVIGTSLSSYSGTFIGTLPTELRTVLKSVTKYTDNAQKSNGSESDVTATTDYAFLLSPFEINGSTKATDSGSHVNNYEAKYQRQYAYYLAGNSYIKYRYNSTGSRVSYWLRSPSAVNSGFFYVDASSTPTIREGYSSNYALGIAPAFCV